MTSSVSEGKLGPNWRSDSEIGERIRCSWIITSNDASESAVIAAITVLVSYAVWRWCTTTIASARHAAGGFSFCHRDSVRDSLLALVPNSGCHLISRLSAAVGILLYRMLNKRLIFAQMAALLGFSAASSHRSRRVLSSRHDHTTGQRHRTLSLRVPCCNIPTDLPTM